jgi:hypothetical protein
MGKSLLRFAVAFAAVMLAVRPAASWTCDDFSTLATKAVNAIRQMGGCGFDMKNSMYSTNPGTHNRWCRALQNSDPDAVETRLKDLTAQAEKCEFCNRYATLVSDAARDNIAYGCGLKDRKYSGGRWNPDRNFHFTGCMAYTNPDHNVIGPSTLGQSTTAAYGYHSEVIGDVTLEIALCKQRHPVPKGCMSGCHGGSQSVFLARPEALQPPPKRGSDGHNFSVARQPPSFKRDGTSSGDSDKAQPSGERRRTPAGSSNSAMDRLGGGGSGGAPSGDRQSGGGSAARPSGGGGASSAPAGGSSAPNIGRNTIMEPGATPGQLRGPGLR